MKIRDNVWASLVAQLIKNLPAMWETQGSIPWLGRSPGGGNGNPFQYSCLEKPHGQRSLQATVHRVPRSWTLLSDFTYLLLGRKAMTNLDSKLKAKTLFCWQKVSIVKAMVFSSSHVWMWEWTIKKAEHWRIDAFELWCWRRLLRVPWRARRSNQSILKEITPEYSLEGPTVKLKLQYVGYLIWRTDSLEKTLMLGKIEGRRRRG